MKFKLSDPKKTPLYDAHVSLGAKIVPFAGYAMPVQYSGIRQEHEAVRKTLGLFDVSHMGNFFVSGPGAYDFLQMMTVNDVEKLRPMDVQYSALCYDNGTVVDDILVYRLEDGVYKLVVNASNIGKDFAWLSDHKPANVQLRDASAELCILSLQGPQALAAARSLMESDPAAVPTYKAARVMAGGVEMLASRTGYTGEDGFEFFPENRHATGLWNNLLEAGKPLGLLPIGLGARDTLRLEAGYSLYGHELTDRTNLIEAGLGWITDFNKGEFVGRAALETRAKAGLESKLVGLELLELAIPREGCKVLAGGEEIGAVTSGTMSPTLNKGIALAYVKAAWAKTGKEVEVLIRDTPKRARVTGRHFYKRSQSSTPKAGG